MSHYTALLDANVLYPAPMRDVLMQLAVTDIFKAKWSEDIHREWIDALMRNEPHRDRETLERTRDLMNHATRDCLVTGYEALIPSLDLPDPDDRHVLAAAIVGRCDVIVTQNLFKFEYLDESEDGKILGEFRSSGLRPYTLEKARQFGFDQAYLEACL